MGVAFSGSIYFKHVAYITDGRESRTQLTHAEGTRTGDRTFLSAERSRAWRRRNALRRGVRRSGRGYLQPEPIKGQQDSLVQALGDIVHPHHGRAELLHAAQPAGAQGRNAAADHQRALWSRREPSRERRRICVLNQMT